MIIGINTKKNTLIKASTGREVNYTNGNYIGSVNDKGSTNLVAISIIDLETGKTIKRKKIGTIKDYSLSRATWIQESEQIQISLINNVLNHQKTRKIVLGSINYNDI